MQALRFETTVPPNGELQLKLSEFRPGEVVEVIVLSLHRVQDVQDMDEEFPLKNTVLKYEAPTEPVAVEEWDLLQ